MSPERPGSSGAFLARPAVNVVAAATRYGRIDEVREPQPQPAEIDDSLRRQRRDSHRINTVTACQRSSYLNVHAGRPSSIGPDGRSPPSSSRAFSIVRRFRMNVGVSSHIPGEVRVCLVVWAHGPRAGQISCTSTGTSWTKRGPRAGRSKLGSDTVTTVLLRPGGRSWQSSNSRPDRRFRSIPDAVAPLRSPSADRTRLLRRRVTHFAAALLWRRQHIQGSS